jgi:hypothetical protein
VSVTRIGPAVIVASAILAAVTGSAQTRSARPAAKAPPAKAAPGPKPAAPSKADEPSKVAAEPRGLAQTEHTEVKAPGSAGTASDAGVSVVQKDGGARQFRFGETEVEGRLKAPQLVYFLRRVRAEFAAGDLGHRSFMRELSETRKDKSF